MQTQIRIRAVFGRVTEKDKATGKRTVKLDKNGMAPVSLELFQRSVRRYLPTGIKLKPQEWDNKRNEVKGNRAYNDNITISRQIAGLQDFILSFPTLHGRPFSLVADFNLIKQTSTQVPGSPAKQLAFTDYMLDQVELEKSKLSPGAYSRYKRTAQNMIAFNGGKSVSFSSLDYSFIAGFDHYLRDVRPDGTYHQNTIVNEHKGINKYLKQAGKGKNRLVDPSDNPYLEFGYDKVATHKDVLYPEEIARIEKLTFTARQSHLERCRDAFLFSIYTLLRISDITGLRQSNLTKTDKGLLLELVADKTRKTNPKHRLPLFDLHPANSGPSLPERIAEKYVRTDNRPLFQQSRVKLNKHIKVIAKLAGIEKHVTFHTARHSGITWLVLLGLEMPNVQSLAQHNDIATTMQYVHLAKPITDKRLASLAWDKAK